MFIFALLIGIYSYIIFALGINGLLYKNVAIWSALIFWSLAFYWYRNNIIKTIKYIKPISRLKNKLLLLFALIFILQVGINFIGALGPELAFDALWYHLTLPKLYLEHHSISYIPGGLLYYSAMPKLAEMLYLTSLAFNGEILAKVIHFSFGLLTCLALYNFQRKFFSPLISMIGVVIFYSNLVVAWESITTYVDLIRAFFEVIALWAFVNWWEDRKRKWFVLSAIMVGLAVTTKLLAIGSLIIFSLLIFLSSRPKWRRHHEVDSTLVVDLIQYLLTYWLIVLAVPLPWFIFSYINTGNPVYPFFSEIYKIAPEPLTTLDFFSEIWDLFTNSPDPLSPLYMIFLPIIIFSSSKFKQEIKIISLYSALAVLVWFFTPRTGGGRFILPYLPALSISCAACLNFLIENKKKYGVYITKFLVIIIILVSFTSIGYRFTANSKYIPVLLGKESKSEFLTSHLNFSFGDFYDTDGYFKKNIKKEDKVLLIGFHNLYYADFPFIDASWLKEGDKFNYIATQNTQLPQKYKSWKLIYTNTKTMVKLYTR